MMDRSSESREEICMRQNKHLLCFLPTVMKAIQSNSMGEHVQKSALSRRQSMRLGALCLGSYFLQEQFAQDVSAEPNPAIAQTREFRAPPVLRSSGSSVLLEQYDNLVVEFLYPSAWIISRHQVNMSQKVRTSTAVFTNATPSFPLRGKVSGLTVGDYNKSEGLALYISSDTVNVPLHDLDAMTIARLVTPGDVTGQEPQVVILGDRMGNDGYRTIDTKYESITVSGYAIERRGITRCTILKDSRVYALSGNCTVNRWKKIGDILTKSIESFQVYEI